jgi:hypothetical protein
MRSVKKQNLKKPAPPAGIPAGCQPDYTAELVAPPAEGATPQKKIKGAETQSHQMQARVCSEPRLELRVGGGISLAGTSVFI